MKIITLIPLLLLISCSSLDNRQDSSQTAQRYVPGTEDLPVYQGFQPIETENIVYDSESGRIIDAAYSRIGDDKNDVINFYAEALPQLGWKKRKTSEYIRDGETLKLSVIKKQGTLYLKFVIRPAA